MKTMNLAQFYRQIKFLLHLSLGLLISMGLFGSRLQSSQAQDEPAVVQPGQPSAPSPGIFGVEMDRITVEAGLEVMTQAGAYWIRRNALMWSEVQPTESGGLNWPAVSYLDGELINAAERGMQVILIVRGTPTWAQKIPGADCGPVKAEKMAAFAAFLHEAVIRYSASPYNVKYWELWNEPDVAPDLVNYHDPYGCWGDASDPYYGGGYYAQMLKAVYPQVKAADPEAQVLVGGLLLNCDTRSVCPEDIPPKFLEGILRFEGNTGGNYFDGVSFHAYDHYGGDLGRYENLKWDSDWKTTGPVHLTKAEFIRSLLSDYGIIGKYLINSESSLKCFNACNKTFETTKAYYLAQNYASAIAHGLRANVWYSARSDWRDTALLRQRESDLFPTQAYFAFKFAQAELNNAAFVQKITQYSGVAGYAFKRSDRRVWLIWSLDGATHPVTLPEMPLAIYQVDGTAMPPSASLSISLEPLYIELPPANYVYLPLFIKEIPGITN